MDDLPIIVTQLNDNTFAIDWDDTHPITSFFNNWTERDFYDAILKGLQEQILDKRDNA